MLRKGSLLKTVSPAKDVMAVATIQEEIVQDAGIYNIPQFLSVLTLFSDPEIKFEDKYFKIFDGVSSMNYTYAQENMILSPKKDYMDIPEPFAVANMSWNELKKLIDAANALQLPEIEFSSLDNQIHISTVNKKNPTSNVYSIYAEAETKKTKKVTIASGKLKLLPVDYTVSFTDSVVEFKSPLATYWIAVEVDTK
jgi:hypothetical protein